jgi:hypothetical protein
MGNSNWDKIKQVGYSDLFFCLLFFFLLQLERIDLPLSKVLNNKNLWQLPQPIQAAHLMSQFLPEHIWQGVTVWSKSEPSKKSSKVWRNK